MPDGCLTIEVTQDVKAGQGCATHSPNSKLQQSCAVHRMGSKALRDHAGEQSRCIGIYGRPAWTRITKQLPSRSYAWVLFKPSNRTPGHLSFIHGGRIPRRSKHTEQRAKPQIGATSAVNLNPPKEVSRMRSTWKHSAQTRVQVHVCSEREVPFQSKQNSHRASKTGTGQAWQQALQQPSLWYMKPLNTSTAVQPVKKAKTGGAGAVKCTQGHI